MAWLWSIVAAWGHPVAPVFEPGVVYEEVVSCGPRTCGWHPTVGDFARAVFRPVAPPSLVSGHPSVLVAQFEVERRLRNERIRRRGDHRLPRYRVRILHARPVRWPELWRALPASPPSDNGEPAPFIGRFEVGRRYRVVLARDAQGVWGLPEVEEPAYYRSIRSYRWVDDARLPAGSGPCRAIVEVVDSEYRLRLAGVRRPHSAGRFEAWTVYDLGVSDLVCGEPRQ